MKHYGITKLIPKLAELLPTLVRKFLDFSDYKHQKHLIKNIELQNEFSIAEQINSEQIQNYFKTINSTLFESGDGARPQMVLIGGHEDGAYVTNIESTQSTNWICVGLGSHFQFELELVRLGNKVLGFDQNIGSNYQSSKNLEFHNMHWDVFDSDKSITLNSMLNKAELKEGENWCLKFDIEGAEWKVWSQVMDLENKPQTIVCELHDLIPRYKDKSLQYKITKLADLAQFYIPIFVKPNNYSAYVVENGIGLYDVLEITWLLKSSKSEKIYYANSSISELTIVNDATKKVFPIGLLRNQI